MKFEMTAYDFQIQPTKQRFATFHKKASAWGLNTPSVKVTKYETKP
jgi:hypothetical protein